MSDSLAEQMAARWSARSPVEVANQFSAPLYGSPGEWDLPADIEPKRELLYLAVGIPDASSLPKTALASASQSVFDKPGDLALRYGFGQGPNVVREWLAAHRNLVEGTDVTGDWYQLPNGSSGANAVARHRGGP